MSDQEEKNITISTPPLKWDEIGIYGWILILFPVAVIIGIFIVTLGWEVIKKISDWELENNPDAIYCPLCDQKIRLTAWNGRHREKCIVKNAVRITYKWFRLNPEVPCPMCEVPMRRLDSYPRHFKCCVCREKAIHSGCFLCDFVLCEECMDFSRIRYVDSLDGPQALPTIVRAQDYVPPNAPPYEAVVMDEEFLPSYTEATMK